MENNQDKNEIDEELENRNEELTEEAEQAAGDPAEDKADDPSPEALRIADLEKQLAGEKDLKIQEVLSSLNWPEWLKRRGLCIFFLKTCLGSFRMTEAGRLVSSSPRFMTWGIMSNGLCLTANILESRNQDGGCSLSDILIPDAPEKYFLSLEQMQKLLYRSSMDGWANESMILPESPAHRTPADNPDSTL